MKRPLEIYHRFQQLLFAGDFARLGEVVDIEGYTENCVGITGWTTGLQIAAANFQKAFAPAFRDLNSTELDVVEGADSLALRTRVEATHVGPFLGHAATNRRVSWEAIDLVRIKDGRIVWRYLLSDWHGLAAQLRA
jgi:predicted ester cyclase